MEDAKRELFDRGDQFDFLRRAGEAPLVPLDSVSCRVFKSPLTLFIGVSRRSYWNSQSRVGAVHCVDALMMQLLGMGLEVELG